MFMNTFPINFCMDNGCILIYIALQTAVSCVAMVAEGKGGHHVGFTFS